ncbi:MAG: hypothetical protein EAX81_02380 [Candidatus Thorarchaeota archaeon]|nr:hypothetical protein [Candidatus Thorarchaeota archaeon]
MQTGISTPLEAVTVPVLIRRPSFPRKWDSLARPHVAIVVKDTDSEIRYYLSRRAKDESSNRDVLEVADIDDLPEGTLLEVRFNATKANLYKMETVDNVPCWRWVGRCRELADFDYPSEIRWNGLLENEEYPENSWHMVDS